MSEQFNTCQVTRHHWWIFDWDNYSYTDESNVIQVSLDMLKMMNGSVVRGSTFYLGPYKMMVVQFRPTVDVVDCMKISNIAQECARMLFLRLQQLATSAAFYITH